MLNPLRHFRIGHHADLAGARFHADALAHIIGIAAAAIGKRKKASGAKSVRTGIMAVILLIQIPGHPRYGAALLETVINTALPALHAPILQQKLVHIRIGYGFLCGDCCLPRRGRQVNDDGAQLCRFRRTVRAVRLGNGIKGKLFTGISRLCAVLEQAAPRSL